MTCTCNCGTCYLDMHSLCQYNECKEPDAKKKVYKYTEKTLNKQKARETAHGGKK